MTRRLGGCWGQHRHFGEKKTLIVAGIKPQFLIMFKQFIPIESQINMYSLIILSITQLITGKKATGFSFHSFIHIPWILNMLQD
jgi:hypothetical protein